MSQYDVLKSTKSNSEEYDTIRLLFAVIKLTSVNGNKVAQEETKLMHTDMMQLVLLRLCHKLHINNTQQCY